MKNETADYDTSWKDAIEDFFEDFLLFFASDLYEQVDLTAGFEFKDKEFSKLFPRSSGKNRRTDKLIKVKLKNGKNKWILVHVEVQGYYQKTFTERMFRYFYRIYDKYQKRIFTLAIFTNSVRSFKPEKFQYKFIDTELTYLYRTYKVLEQSEKKLIEDDNPFALVVLAALYVINSKGDVQKKYRFKYSLAKLLFERNYEREKIDKLFIFVDRVLTLPPELEEKIEENIILKSEEGKKVGLTWDKSNLAQMYKEKGEKAGKEEGIKKGMKEGLKEGKKEELLETLSVLLGKKFATNNITNKYLSKLKSLELKQLRKIRDNILEINSPEELDKYIEE